MAGEEQARRDFTDKFMNENGFFSELKRRNVYKVAVAYAVVAWLLIQIATQVFPFLQIPDWATRLVIVLLALGFPIALVIAWAFELTPDGLRRTETAGGEAVPSRKRGWIYIVLVAALLSLGLFFAGRLTAPAPAPAPLAGPTKAPEKSIAVLPFESLSEDKANAFFAVGVQDEILTRLAKVGALKVISRTSTQRYQSKPTNLPEIARELGVAYVLEGSVQKSGENVRVNVQLIQAETDAHLWAETYDRKLAEIFQVQSEIALRIARELEAKLTGAERREIGIAGTNNPQAYEAYLRGLALDTAQTAEETRIARESFRRAVELDPNFALAWAALANREAFHGFRNRTPEQFGRAREAMEMALKLQPEASESFAAAASFYYYCPQDFPRALEYLTKARQLAPNNGFVIMLMGAVKRRQGHLEESIELMQQASVLDPRNNDIWMNLARSYRGARRFAEAHTMFDRALQISPGDAAIISEKAEAFAAVGKLEEAGRLLEATRPEPGGETFDDYVQFHLLKRDYARATELLAAARAKAAEPEQREAIELQRAYVQAMSGKLEEARPVFQRERSNLEARQAQGNESVWLREELVILSALLGDRATMEKRIAELIKATAQDKWHLPVSEQTAGEAYALLGDVEHALPHLERALSMPGLVSLTPAYLRLDGRWDGIRNDPRFQKLAAGQP